MRSIAGDLNIPLSGSSCNFQRLAEENGESKNEGQETEPQVRLLLCPYFCEYQRFRPGQIPNTVEFDLVICMLWSRLGPPLIPMLRLPDGNLSASGTEYGIAWGMDHANKHRGIPPLNVYRNRSTPTLPLEPKPSAKPLASNGTPCRTFLQISAKTARGIPPQLLATITTSRNLRRPSKALDCGGGRQRRRRLLRCLGGRAAGATCAAGHWRDPESPNAIRDLERIEGAF